VRRWHVYRGSHNGNAVRITIGPTAEPPQQGREVELFGVQVRYRRSYDYDPADELDAVDMDEEASG
jgi:hypothetical protein